MTLVTNSNHYERGLELAEAGKYQEALACIQEHLHTAPDDAQVLNDAGAILYCLGRCDEAINHFVKAKSLQGDSAEIVWNLVEAYLGEGRANEAMQLFDDMEWMGILDADVLNRTANALLEQDNKGGAIEMLLRSLEVAPDQKILQPMIEVIRSKMPKVAFFCGGDGFRQDNRIKQAPKGVPKRNKKIHEIGEFIKQRFEVRLFEDQAEEELVEVMKWSDISWFEPGHLAVTASKLAETSTG